MVTESLVVEELPVAALIRVPGEECQTARRALRSYLIEAEQNLLMVFLHLHPYSMCVPSAVENRDLDKEQSSPGRPFQIPVLMELRTAALHTAETLFGSPGTNPLGMA